MENISCPKRIANAISGRSVKRGSRGRYIRVNSLKMRPWVDKLAKEYEKLGIPQARELPGDGEE